MTILGCLDISRVKRILRGLQPKMILNFDEVVIHISKNSGPL